MDLGGRAGKESRALGQTCFVNMNILSTAGTRVSLRYEQSRSGRAGQARVLQTISKIYKVDIVEVISKGDFVGTSLLTGFQCAPSIGMLRRFRRKVSPLTSSHTPFCIDIQLVAEPRQA